MRPLLPSENAKMFSRLAVTSFAAAEYVRYAPADRCWRSRTLAVREL
jgi:hypothetical protein